MSQTPGLIEITPSEALPITVADVKRYANITIDGDDVLLGEMLLAATVHFERISGFRLRPVEYDWETQRALCRETALPLFPIASITSVKYLDADDVEQTVDSADYSLKKFDHPPHVLRFPADYTLPSSKKAVIRFTVGYDGPIGIEDISGTKDGVNDSFTISWETGTVFIYLNGQKLTEGLGYTRSGTVITALGSKIPQSGDTYEAALVPTITATPSPIRQAIKFLVAHWYENREAYMEDKLSAVPAAWESIVMSATDHQFA